jgi:hypothetical protein
MSKDLPSDKLNELLAKAVARLQAGALTLVELDPQPFKPYLPESYWAERELLVHHETERLLDLAEHMRERKARRAYEDRMLAENVSVESVLNEGLDLDRSKLPSHWGSMTMQQASRWSNGRTVRPHPGNPQPTFSAMCVGCGRPITRTTHGQWKDHAGKVKCPDDLCDYPHDMDQTSSMAWFHGHHRDTDIEPEDGEEDEE